MTRNLVPRRNILSRLKERNKESKTEIKQVYNVHHICKLSQVVYVVSNIDAPHDSVYAKPKNA
jgi:NurA-like 5'-3' nuclease